MKGISLLVIIALAVAGFAWWWAGHSDPTPVANKTLGPSAPASPTLAAPAAIAPHGTSTPIAGAERPVPIVSPTPAEMEAALKKVLDLESPARKQVKFAKLLDAARTPEQLAALLKVFAERFNAGKRDSAEWGLFWSEVVGRDTAVAARLAEGYALDEPDAHANAIMEVMYEWAKKDPRAAAEWFNGRTELSEKQMQRGTLNLIAGFAEKDINGAAAYALALPKGDPAWGQATWILSNTLMSKGGAKGLTSWYDGLSESEARRRYFYAVAFRLGQSSLPEQVDWLTKQAANPLRDDRPYRDAAGTWAEKEPLAALNWALSLPPSPKEQGHVGLGYAAFPWMVKDLAGFHQHFQTMAPEHQQEIIKVVKIVTDDPKTPDAKLKAGKAFLDSLGM